MDDLTQQVKRKLNITWSDEDTDGRVLDIIASGQASMAHKLGVEEDFDFTKPGQENALFLAWCLYEWNHASNEFDANYANDIMQCRQKRMVEEMAYAEADQV